MFNKYCFFSSVIENNILIFNSQDDCTILLDQSTYNNLLSILENQQNSNEPIIKKLLELNFLVNNNSDAFDVDKFKNKISTIHRSMETYITYYLVAESISNNSSWQIKDIELIECINGIKSDIQDKDMKDTLIIVKVLNEDKTNHYRTIINSVLSNLKYKIEFTVVENCYSNFESIKKNVPNEGLTISELNLDYNIEKTIINLCGSSQSFLKDKSMQLYVNEINTPRLFLQHINPLEMLCPFLLDNFLIIDYGVLVKKCTRQYDPNTIVGFVDGGKIILNRKYSNYILGIDRLHEECLKCRYIYICLGQNCKYCPSNNIISCMPLGRMINKSLNQYLIDELNKRGDKNEI